MLVFLIFLIMLLAVVMGFFAFETPLCKLYERESWRRFECRTGIKRPDDT